MASGAATAAYYAGSGLFALVLFLAFYAYTISGMVSAMLLRTAVFWDCSSLVCWFDKKDETDQSLTQPGVLRAYAVLAQLALWGFERSEVHSVARKKKCCNAKFEMAQTQELPT